MAKKATSGIPNRRILIYENRKTGGPLMWDASTEALEAGAYLALFKVLDEDWHVYYFDEPKLPKFPAGHPEGCMCETCIYGRKTQERHAGEVQELKEQRELYKAAKKGDADAARALLNLRNNRDSEYERFTFDTMYAATAAYAPRTWGVTKPCGTAIIYPNGVYIWGNHGNKSFGIRPTQEAAVKYLTEGFLRYDATTREEIEVPARELKFRPQKPKESDEEYATKCFNAEPSEAAQALAVLKKGGLPQATALRFTKQVCNPCKRNAERFDV